MCRSRLSAVQVKYVISATSFGSTQCTAKERAAIRSVFCVMAERLEAMSCERSNPVVAADPPGP